MGEMGRAIATVLRPDLLRQRRLVLAHMHMDLGMRKIRQAAGMIDVAVEAADRFFPAFDFLVKGAKSPAEAIAACMFETLGEA